RARAPLFGRAPGWRGFRVVLLEARSRGMGAATSDCPPAPADLIDDRRNGVLVAPEDTDALAGGIGALMEDEDLRRRCGAAAVETARAYTIDAIGPRWKALLDDLASERAARGGPGGRPASPDSVGGPLGV